MKSKYNNQKQFFLTFKGRKASVPPYDGIICGYRKDTDSIILLQDKPNKGLNYTLNSYIAPEYRNHPNGYLSFRLSKIIIL